MFIETALKNIALNTIMTEIDSSSVYDMYDKAISSYKNAPAGTREDIKKTVDKTRAWTLVHALVIYCVFYQPKLENGEEKPPKLP